MTGVILAVGFCGATIIVFTASYIYNHIFRRVGTQTQVKVYDGNTISAVAGDVGAALVYQEMYEQKVYFQHGFTLEGVKNPIVVDAGVNIGLFSRYIAEHFPTAKVFGAEPIDVISDMARRNTCEYADRVKIATLGLGKDESSMTIEYRPTLSSASTMHPDEVASAASKDAVDWLRGLLLDGIRGGTIPSFPIKTVCILLGVPYFRFVVLVAILPFLILGIAWFKGGELPKRRLTARITTMDTFLKELGAPASGPIHLLKVDVEGAELDVLEGMSEQLWARVQQLVVETHNIDNRVDRVRKLLVSKGFKNVQFDKEEWEVHRLLDITSLFASRN